MTTASLNSFDLGSSIAATQRISSHYESSNMGTGHSTLEPLRYVGFDTIPAQIERKLLKRGFQFNIMLVGHSGLGKSTFINTLFASHLADSKGRVSCDEPISTTTEINTVAHIIEENGVRLLLNIIDTPGFGDQINNERCWDPIIKYIKDQHSTYLRKELTAQRDRYIVDSRVHVCLYFIQPTVHGLKPLDIIVLRRLCEVANVIPVIAKSDSLTFAEKLSFKRRIREEINFHRLHFYPYDSEQYDDEERQLNSEIRELIPFAIVGSEKEIDVNGKKFLGRQNKWGIVDLENPEHCDFVALRDFLTRTHLQDLIDTTSYVHYEAFRSKQLIALKESNASNPQVPQRGMMQY